MLGDHKSGQLGVEREEVERRTDILDSGDEDGRAELQTTAAKLQARPALLGAGIISKGPHDSNEICCMLNHQHRLTLPRSTAAPAATQLRVVLTLHLLLLQRRDSDPSRAVGRGCAEETGRGAQRGVWRPHWALPPCHGAARGARSDLKWQRQGSGVEQSHRHITHLRRGAAAGGAAA